MRRQLGLAPINSPKYDEIDRSCVGHRGALDGETKQQLSEMEIHIGNFQEKFLANGTAVVGGGD